MVDRVMPPAMVLDVYDSFDAAKTLFTDRLELCR